MAPNVEPKQPSRQRKGRPLRQILERAGLTSFEVESTWTSQIAFPQSHAAEVAFAPRIKIARELIRKNPAQSLTVIITRSMFEAQ